MDEIEISGRQYISTKRAAKKHKYHSDYIGQLIRGKKVVGQKVGRSWYVDAESLERYLNNEGPAPISKPETLIPSLKVAEVAAPKVVEPEPIIEEKIEEVVVKKIEEPEAPEIVEVAIKEVAVQEKIEVPIVIEEVPKEKIPVTIHFEKEVGVESKSEKKNVGLRYIEEAPLMPPLQKMQHALNVMPRRVVNEPQPTQQFSESQPQPRRARKNFTRMTTLMVVGGVMLCLAAAASALLISTTNVVAGQPAATHLSVSANTASF